MHSDPARPGAGTAAWDLLGSVAGLVAQQDLPLLDRLNRRHTQLRLRVAGEGGPGSLSMWMAL